MLSLWTRKRNRSNNIPYAWYWEGKSLRTGRALGDRITPIQVYTPRYDNCCDVARPSCMPADTQLGTNSSKHNHLEQCDSESCYHERAHPRYDDCFDASPPSCMPAGAHPDMRTLDHDQLGPCDESCYIERCHPRYDGCFDVSGQSCMPSNARLEMGNGDHHQRGLGDCEDCCPDWCPSVHCSRPCQVEGCRSQPCFSSDASRMPDCCHPGSHRQDGPLPYHEGCGCAMNNQSLNPSTSTASEVSHSSPRTSYHRAYPNRTSRSQYGSSSFDELESDRSQASVQTEWSHLGSCDGECRRVAG